jgi:hypothetical protein
LATAATFFMRHLPLPPPVYHPLVVLHRLRVEFR